MGPSSSVLRTAALGCAMLFSAACGTARHSVALDPRYSAAPGTALTVGSVENRTGQAFDVDVEALLAAALRKALAEKDLLWRGGSAPELRISAEIVQYEKGNAFKRWLMPGWGSTVLVVRGTLLGDGARPVGRVDAKRTVDAGGAYTVNAWMTIFERLAEDVVLDLARQLRPKAPRPPEVASD